MSDGETSGSLEVCTLIRIASQNKAATRALDEEDVERLFDVAGTVAPLRPPDRA